MAEALRHITECPVCMLRYREPKILPCDHSLCKNCVSQIQKASKIKCPLCNATHAAKTLRTDFRLEQILDAVQGTTDSEESVAATLAGSECCDICCKVTSSFRCEECAQNMCHDCKTGHLRSKASSTHRIFPTTESPRVIPDKFHQQTASIKYKMDQQSKSIEQLETEINRLQQVQTSTLLAADKLRTEAVKDVNKYYDAIQAKITEFVQKYIRELQLQKQKLAEQLLDLNGKWQVLQDMVKDNSVLPYGDISRMLEEASKMSSDLCSPDYSYIKPVQIHVKLIPGQAWDVSKSATLELSDGNIVMPKSTETFRTESEKLLNRKSPLHLKTFSKEKEVKLKHCPNALRLVKQQLWSCNDNGCIQVYNRDLQNIQFMQFKELGNIYDVTEIPDGTVLLACSKGLVVITPIGSGKVVRYVDSKEYNSLALYRNKLYAYAPYPSRICVFSLSDSFKKIDKIKLPFSAHTYVTLNIANTRITACSTVDNKIITLSLDGQILQTYGDSRSWSADNLNFAFICQEVQDMLLLIADRCNNCLKTVDRRGEWFVIRMTPVIKDPRSAVFIDNNLYVVSCCFGKIALYRSN